MRGVGAVRHLIAKPVRNRPILPSILLNRALSGSTGKAAVLKFPSCQLSSKRICGKGCRLGAYCPTKVATQLHVRTTLGETCLLQWHPDEAQKASLQVPVVHGPACRLLVHKGIVFILLFKWNLSFVTYMWELVDHIVSNHPDQLVYISESVPLRPYC